MRWVIETKASIDLNSFLIVLKKINHLFSKLNLISILVCSFLLAGGVFYLSHLRMVIISSATLYCLENKDKTECNQKSLRRKRLAHKEITDVIFTRCFCEDVRLFNVKVSDSDFRENVFKRAHLEKVSFFNMNFFKATFYGAVLDGVVFENSELGGAEFNFATLRNVHFKNIDLRSVVFVGTRFEKSYYDEDTKLPFSKERAARMGLYFKE